MTDPAPTCRVIIRQDYQRKGRSRRAWCQTCFWKGPWVRYTKTAERHRQAHLHIGVHRA